MSETDTWGSRKTLTEDWRSWIETNFQRNCTIESMVAQMVRDGGFAEDFAKEAVQSVTSAPVSATKQTFGIYRAPASTLADGHVIEIEDHKVYVMARMKSPLITVLDNMLTPAECEELMALSEARLKRNTVVDNQSGDRVDHKDRTSEGTWWDRGANEFISRLDRRIAHVSGIPLERSEGIQVMRYKPGGQYKAHHDYFPMHLPGSKVQTVAAKGGQRCATMLMYLQPPASGGETEFPDVGFRMIPKQGSAVYFEYMDGDGNVDSKTLHAGLPVIAGVKWIATRWLRELAF